jgi:hypothetical protein
MLLLKRLASTRAVLPAADKRVIVETMQVFLARDVHVEDVLA